MISAKQAATEFLALKRIAATGVPRKPQGHGANVGYQRLRDRGYTVFAINPNADQVEGDQSYQLGIDQVWMHRLYGAGSVSEAATQYGRDHGITVIDGGCPLMFDPTADAGHKMLGMFARATGKSPRRV